MKFTKSPIVKLIIAILAFSVLSYVFSETSMNFTYLGGIAIIMVLFIIRMPNLNQANMVANPPVRNIWLGYISSLLITVFSIMTLYTLSNYFYADKEVYSNNEHHAIRIDGVKVKNTENFLLVKNDNAAFFDNKEYHGSVFIEEVDSEHVTLRLNEFIHPVYHYVREEIKNLIRERKIVVDSLLNDANKVIAFTSNDTLTFTNRNGESLEFWMKQINIENKNGRDSVLYYFRDPETGVEQLSRFNQALVIGYDFNGLLDSVHNSKIDFSGVSICRVFSRPQSKQYNRINDNPTRYLLNLNEVSFNTAGLYKDGIACIAVGNKKYNLDNLASLDHLVKIPYGEFVYIGYGESKTPIFSFERDSTAENSVFIKYRMPYYRHLYNVEKKIENNLYVTSSLFNVAENENVNSWGVNLPDNIALFNIFDKKDNIHHFQPFHLSYVTGPTTERMNVLCEETGKSYFADEYFGEVKSSSGIEWLVKIENFRETTPYKAEKMWLVVFFVCLAAILVSNVQFLRFSTNFRHRFTFSYAEFTLHIALIFFIAFRCFLLWRTSVFIPIDNVSKYELDTIFRESEHFNIMLAGIIVFYSALFIAKVCVLFYDRKSKNIDNVHDTIYDSHINTVIKWCQSNLILIIPPIVYIVSVIISKAINTRFALVGLVLSYMITDVIIYARSKYYTCTLSDIKDENDRMCVLSTFLWSLFNMMCAIAIMALIIKDNGFTIIFVSFCLFAIGFKMQDSYVKLAKNSDNKFKFPLFLVLYFMVTFAMLLGYKSIVIGILESKYSILLIAVALIVAFWGICLLFGISTSSLKRKIIDFKNFGIVHIFAIVVTLSFVVGVYFTVNFVINDECPFDGMHGHTKQRINVMLKEPHEILAETESNGEELRFLQASYNHWLIEEYHDRSKNVALFGESGHGYFKLHPQSKLGALWNAQVTDIVTLRYVITEHSKVLPIIFIFLLLSMLIYAVKMNTYFRFTRTILIQVPLLLFVQALLVWMANTQRFVFFGQDFPFVSITTKAMLVYVFALLTLWVLAVVYESFMYRNHEVEDYHSLETFNKMQTRIIGVTLSVIVALSFLIGNPSSTGTGKYQLDKLEGKINPYLECIDSLFGIYQKEKELVLRRDMYAQIYSFDKLYSNLIDSLLKEKAYKLGKDTAEYHFPLRIWRNYVNGGSHDNTLNSLLHIHYKDNRLAITFKNNFYDVNLPLHNDKEWKGSIVEHKVQKDIVPGTNKTKDYKYYCLPSSWVNDTTPSAFIKSYRNDYLKIYSLSQDKSESFDNSGIESVRVLEDNELLMVGNEVAELPYNVHNYWARNVLINGQNSFVYPQADDMYWVRDFARIVEDVQEDKIANGVTGTQDVNIPITLDRELTSEVYAILEKDLKNGNKYDARSVIVADGNGHIKCMVDYKKGFSLNPNDEEKIQEITEDLYMNYSLNKDRLNDESYWFENRNLVHMKGGPGSTQKPLILNAVASGINYDWTNLVLNKINTNALPKINGDFVLNYFKGEPVKKFRSIASDEGSGNNDVTLDRYLSKSSNYYNAVLTYIGLHKTSLFTDPSFMKIQSGTDTLALSLFKEVGNPMSMIKENYVKGFPFMKIENKFVVLNRSIDRGNYKDNILYKQTTEVYGLKDSNSSSRSANKLYQGILVEDACKKYPATIPASSSLNFNFLFEDRNERNTVRSIATGDARLWTVTPLHMTEMYGKLVSLNKKYTLSFNPIHKNETEFYVQDKNNKNLKSTRKMMFYGMSQFFIEGTGKDIVKNKDDKVVSQKTIDGKTYYFYGKTGTTDGGTVDLNKDKKEDKFRRLIIVISDTNLHEKAMSNEDYDKVKFYVLFFTYDFSSSGFKKSSSDVISKVMESDAFKEYMNSSN